MATTGTILILERDEEWARLLAGEGYRLAAAQDASEALAHAAQVPPDLVMVDVAGLGSQGLDLVHALRSQPPLAEVPLLVVVAPGSMEAGQALDCGADDWLSTAGDLDEMRARLRTYIRLSRSRRQLSEAVGRHAAEMTILNRIGQLITSSLDLPQALSIIADHAHWLLDVAAAAVILTDSDREELWFGAASGEAAASIQGQRLARGDGLVDWVIENGRALMVQDVSHDPRFLPDLDRQTDYRAQSVLCVPLEVQGQTLGAIEAINKASGPFDDEDLMLLTALASTAAIAVENARLYEEVRLLNQELSARASSLTELVAERTRQLQTERDRTQSILEAVGEAVIVTDLDGNISFLNPAAVELTGYSLEEVTGRPAAAKPGPAPTAVPGPAAARLVHSAEVVSRRRDGTLYDAAMTVAPLFDSQEPGRIVGHVCIQRDITPIKDAERVKDQFVSNVSHELRTPLSLIALISGNLDMLYDRLSDDKRKKMVRDIREHTQVLNDLIGDVLEISKIESGSISAERQAIDLARVLRQEVDKQLPLAQRKGQMVEVTGSEHLAVWGNDEQMGQVIRNLLNNAIKYTPEGGAITCQAEALPAGQASAAWPGSEALPPGQWAAVRIVDNGIGVSAQDLPRLFERFYRVKSEGSVSGTGLGLSIARELVEAHGGQIASASTLGQGSTFAIYLTLLEE